MSRYEKRTNNYFRKIGNDKKLQKKKRVEKLPKELNSITMEFGRMSQKDFLSHFILDELLNKMGLIKYFEVKYGEGTRVLHLLPKRGQTYRGYIEEEYIGEDYNKIAIKMINCISEIICEALDVESFIYVKLYEKNRKKHLYILFDPDDKQIKKWNLMCIGDETIISRGMLEYAAYDDEEASERDFDFYWNDDDEDGYGEDDFEDWDDDGNDC